MCPIIFRGHPSNFKVTRAEKSNAGGRIMTLGISCISRQAYVIWDSDSGVKLAPGQQQPTCWLDCNHSVTWIYYITYISHTANEQNNVRCREVVKPPVSVYSSFVFSRMYGLRENGYFGCFFVHCHHLNIDTLLFIIFARSFQNPIWHF